MPGLKTLVSKLNISRGSNPVSTDQEPKRPSKLRGKLSKKNRSHLDLNEIISDAAAGIDRPPKSRRVFSFRTMDSARMVLDPAAPGIAVSKEEASQDSASHSASGAELPVPAASSSSRPLMDFSRRRQPQSVDISQDEASHVVASPSASGYGLVVPATPRQRQLQIVDNFTRWDAGTRRKSWRLIGDNNPFRDAMIAIAKPPGQELPMDSSDEAWQSIVVTSSDILNISEGTGLPESPESGGSATGKRWEPPSDLEIPQIDWSKFQDDEHVTEYISRTYGSSSDESPVDSAIGLLEEDISPVSKGRGKGKARAVEPESGAGASRRQGGFRWEDLIISTDVKARLREEHEDPISVDGLLARQLAKQEDMLRALEQLKWEEAVWEDQMIARRLQEQEELDRQQQEANDRIEAERLEAEQEVERQRIAEEEREAARLARLRDCVVCGDAKDKLDFPPAKPASACEHDVDTCQECLSTWLASEFDSKGVEDLKCPQCPSKLAYDDILRAASTETFAAYEKMLTRNALSAIPDFAWCLGPSCDNGQLNEDNEHFMDCASCGYKQCLKHKVPWHAGETCTAYDYRTSGQQARDEEAKTEAMLDSVSKKCPGKACGWRIQKADGCDHMTCKRCKFEFCWECLASHHEIKRVGNTAHLTWCKFHSDNLNVSWPFNMH